jgi:8-oxo-dGTP diphosphatase
MVKFNFCPQCGQRLEQPADSGIKRPYCPACSFIHYKNPAVGVAAIVLHQKKILLGKRNGSYRDQWCIPCGYVEWDEDVYAAVEREFLEETGLIISVDRVYTVLSNFHDPKRQTVGIWFLAKASGGSLNAGDDLSQVGYFAYDSIPTLAFPTDAKVLALLKKDGLLL